MKTWKLMLQKNSPLKDVLFGVWLDYRPKVEQVRAGALASYDGVDRRDEYVVEGGCALFVELPLGVGTGVSFGITDLAIALGLNAKEEEGAESAAAALRRVADRQELLQAFTDAAVMIDKNVTGDLDTTFRLEMDLLAEMDRMLKQDSRPEILTGADSFQVARIMNSITSASYGPDAHTPPRGNVVRLRSANSKA